MAKKKKASNGKLSKGNLLYSPKIWLIIIIFAAVIIQLSTVIPSNLAKPAAHKTFNPLVQLSPSQLPDNLEVIRETFGNTNPSVKTKSYLQSHFINGYYFDRKVTDKKLVQRLFLLIYALPTAEPGTYNCPNSTGIGYKLHFYRQETLVLDTWATPDGCRWVNSRWTNDAFWEQLAQTLNVKETDIYPIVQPGPKNSSN